MKLSHSLRAVSARQFLWLLWLLPLCVFVWRLGSVPLFDVDEGAFSEATREMFARHDFLSTWLNGAPRFDKPILIYWCQALAVSVFGVNEFAFRLPSALAASGWAWAVGFFVYQQAPATQQRLSAALASLMVCTSPGIIIIGRAATADALLNFLLVLALFDTWRYLQTQARPALLRSFLWIGLGVLTKGPIALLIPGVTSLLYCLSYKQFKLWLKSVFNPLGWVILLAVCVPWYATILNIHGQAFIDGFLLKHNVARFTGPLEGHSGSAFFYLFIVPALLLPWCAVLWHSVRHIKTDYATPVTRFLWVWSVFVIGFFSLSGTKLPHYALYGCTPLIALMALKLPQLRLTRWSLLPSFVLLIVIASVPFVVPQLTIKDPFYAAQLAPLSSMPLSTYWLLCSVVAGAALYALSARKLIAWQRLSIMATLCLIALQAGLIPLFGELLHGPTKRASLFAQALIANTQEDAVLWNFHAPSFSVYREGVSPTVQATAGQLALTRLDRLPSEPGRVEVLFQEGGVRLVRVLK